MPAQTFMKWKQKMLPGAILKIIAPTGQYDPTKLINWGINRWAFKPQTFDWQPAKYASMCT